MGTYSRYCNLALSAEKSFYRVLEKVNITLLVDLPSSHHKRLLFRVFQGKAKHRLGLGDKVEMHHYFAWQRRFQMQS